MTRTRAVNLIMRGLMLDDGRTGRKTYEARVSKIVKEVREACFGHTNGVHIPLKTLIPIPSVLLRFG